MLLYDLLCSIFFVNWMAAGIAHDFQNLEIWSQSSMRHTPAVSRSVNEIGEASLLVIHKTIKEWIRRGTKERHLILQVLSSDFIVPFYFALNVQPNG